MLSSSLFCRGTVAVLFSSAVSLAATPQLDASTSPPSIPSSQDLTQPVFEQGVELDLQWPEALSSARRSASTTAPAGGLWSSLAASDDSSPGAFSPTSYLSIAESMEEPLVTEPADGRIWVRTRDFRASYGEDGFTVLPVFGARSPQEWPVQFKLDSVRRGSAQLALSSKRPQRIAGGVETQHGSVREVHHLRVDQIEQTFVFDEIPGSGDLEVRLEVETELTPRADGVLLRFEHPEFGYVSYGEAFVVDASGTKAPIVRRWTGDGISLIVPSEFLTKAVLPVTIDPVVSSFSSNFGANDDSSPDICFAGFAQQYCVVWQEYTSATNADVYGTFFSEAGVQGTSYAIEVGNNFWRDPRVAYIPAGGRLLVVATTNASGPGGGSESIKGQLVQVNGANLIGTEFFISTVGQNKIDPVVGGTNYLSATNNHFAVAWSRQTSTNTATIEARIINWDGTAVTGVQLVDTPTNTFAIQPTISATHGDSSLDIDLWTLAWIRDENGNGRGDVMARRLPWSGNLGLGLNLIPITSNDRCSFPTVTSRHDEPLLGSTDRPSILAWQERHITGLSVHQDIVACVVADESHSPTVNLTEELEDLNTARSQIQPSIATDGRSFILTYAESSPTGSSNNYDMYMVSGNATKSGADDALALSERHQVMDSASGPEWYGKVAMRWDGDPTTTSDEAAAIWVRQLAAGPDRGQLMGTILTCGTTSTLPNRAIGVQYCNAFPNSLGVQQGDQTSSWFRIHGTASTTSPANFRCMDMPPGLFGYFLCSRTPGDVVMPGGSSGRLCLGGVIGRFSNTVLTSGTDGAVDMNVAPQVLPQPAGAVAAQPGETWYFQYWHRDASPSGPTSTFSNACLLTYLP